jgi:hypothetical protein
MQCGFAIIGRQVIDTADHREDHMKTNAVENVSSSTPGAAGLPRG